MSEQSAILTEIRENFSHASDYWRDVREQGAIDVRYATEGPWEEDDLKTRKGRVTLTLDELGQYLNQITNEFRQSKRSVKVNPRGNGADDETAGKRADLIREIEYASRAQHAYITAGEDMVRRSYGYFKLATDWKPGTMLRVLKVVRIQNPDVIYLDPDAKEADWSDCGWAFEVEEGMRERDFRKRFGDKSKYTSFDDLAGESKGWVTSSDSGARVRVASYWRREAKPNTLYLLERGHVVDTAKDKGVVVTKRGGDVFVETAEYLPSRVKQTREDNTYTVWKYVTNGLEILEKEQTDFTEIPIIPMFGREVWIPVGGVSKRRFHSAVRLARDAFKAYCYARSAMIERLAMDPKTPYEGYEGQFNTSTDFANINKNPTGYAEFKATTEATGDVILPLPKRTLTEPQINQYEVASESLRRSIQAAMGGSPLPTSAQRQNQKSGIALQTMEQSQDQGNFHFIDNFERAIERAGRMMNAALDIVYDTPREEGFRTEDEKYGVEAINQTDEAGQPVGFQTAQGEFGVTISTGPSYQSQRDAADKFLDTLAGTDMMPRIADLVVKAKQLGPIGDQIAERLAPPDAAGVDPAVQQAMQESQQIIQQLQMELADLRTKAAIDKYKSDQTAATSKYTTDETEKTKRVLGLAQLDQQEALARLEAMIGELDSRFSRMHEASMTAAGQDHEREMAERGHEQSREMAGMQHQQATEMEQMRAEMAPEPSV
jgi:hypothetical protein